MEEARATTGTDPEEALLLGRARRGDREAFCRIVERHQRRVHAQALRLVRRHDLADDVAQEAFVRAWQSLSSFDLGRPFGPWIGRITRNLALNALRGPAARTAALVEDTPDDPAAGPDELVAGRETGAALEQALGELPVEQRSVLLLRAHEEMSYQEIADALGIAPGTVMSRLHRARERLRQLLGPRLGQKRRVSR